MTNYRSIKEDDMNTRHEISRTHKLVKEILETDPKTRNSDDLLYLDIIERSCPLKTTIGSLFRNREYLGIPPYETVRRTRQKIQAEHPELRGDEKRRQRAKDFRAYALTDHETD